MRIKLHRVARRFGADWVFKNLDYEFVPGESYAVAGPNGSGKSTLIKMLAAFLSPTRGEIFFSEGDRKIEASDMFGRLCWAAPYIEPVEEFSFSELIRFQRRFKSFAVGIDEPEFLNLSGLKHHSGKQIRNYSSGMKQRVKIALSVFFHSDLLLLDEPTTNLDAEGVEWYRAMMKQYAGNRLVIIASNTAHDFDFCRHRLEVSAFK